MRRRLLPLLLVASLAAPACSDRRSGDEAAGEGLPAPAFSALTLAGDTVSLSSYRGAPLLVNLWATWCPPCREEMPSLQRVFQDYRDRGLQVVGVSLDNSQAGLAVARFMEDYHIGFTILLDPHDRATTVFRTFGLPETYLIDRHGIMVRRWRGKVDGDSKAFRKELDRVLASSR